MFKVTQFMWNRDRIWIQLLYPKIQISSLYIKVKLTHLNDKRWKTKNVRAPLPLKMDLSGVVDILRASQVALAVKNPPANARVIKRWRLEPWVRKIPWRRAWQPTPIYLPRKPHGQRRLVDCGPKCHTEWYEWGDLAQTRAWTYYNQHYFPDSLSCLIPGVGAWI